MCNVQLILYLIYFNYGSGCAEVQLKIYYCMLTSYIEYISVYVIFGSMNI